MSISEKRQKLYNNLPKTLGRITKLTIHKKGFKKLGYYTVINSPRKQLFYLYETDKKETPINEIGQFENLYDVVDNILLHSGAITKEEYDTFIKSI